jgi:tetratricopeptide (TPR) repeat protein
MKCRILSRDSNGAVLLPKDWVASGRILAMLIYRTILVVVTVLSLIFAGFNEIRNSLGLTVGLMNLCLWSLPLIAKWKKSRDAHRVEGERQLQIGNYSEAEQSLVLALAEAEHRSASAKKRASVLWNLAEAQRKQGKLPQAEQSIRQAIALVSELKGQDIEQYGECLELLADVHRDTGNHPQEQQILQESLKLAEELPKPKPQRSARLRQKLALAYHHSGDHAAAAAHFAGSLELHEQAFGPEHAETGKMLTELGAAQQKEGHHAEALRSLERALAIQEKALGADSPEVTQSLYHLALAYEKSGNLERAAAQFERMLQLRSRQVSGNEGELADVYRHLSRVCFTLGRLARAGEAAQSAILILERKPGPELAAALKTFAAICERSDRREEATAAYERARAANA